jgi:hypothetical protein
VTLISRITLEMILYSCDEFEMIFIEDGRADDAGNVAVEMTK